MSILFLTPSLFFLNQKPDIYAVKENNFQQFYLTILFTTSHLQEAVLVEVWFVVEVIVVAAFVVKVFDTVIVVAVVSFSFGTLVVFLLDIVADLFSAAVVVSSCSVAVKMIVYSIIDYV